MRIAFCTTCKGRTEHLKQTLPRNLADNSFPNVVFIVLDYNSGDGLVEYLKAAHAKDIASGRLVVYSCAAERFHMAHSKNMAARCGILEGADILVTLDADNYAEYGFAGFIADKMREPGLFLCPDFPRIKSLPHGPSRPQRGYAGRLAIRSQDFVKMGGYDEIFDTWRGEDIDMIGRMQRVGLTMGTIENRFLGAISHDSESRFKEYPHAKAYEMAGEWKALLNRTETVVNYGNFGCGTVWRWVYDTAQPIELKPIPTRIFGIGMQKTATSSLHSAFKMLGYDSFHWQTNRKAWRILEETTRMGRSPLLEQSYALSDNPIPILFRQLDAAYPRSKFILTIVDENVWIKSVEDWWKPELNPFYDWDRQPWSHRVHEALYGQRHFDREVFLSRYRRHNAEVVEYFKNRPEDLLVMDMSRGAGWKDLCSFLDEPVPDVPYPHANKDMKAMFMETGEAILSLPQPQGLPHLPELQAKEEQPTKSIVRWAEAALIFLAVALGIIAGLALGKE